MTLTEAIVLIQREVDYDAEYRQEHGFKRTESDDALRLVLDAARAKQRATDAAVKLSRELGRADGN